MMGKLSAATVLVVALVTAVLGRASVEETDGGELQVEFRQLTKAAPWNARSDHASVGFAGKLWVIGGQVANSDSSKSSVWSSSDGEHWEVAQATPPWTNDRSHSAAVLNGAVYLLESATSTDLPPTNELWRSEDGQVWEELHPSHLFKRLGAAFFAFDDKLWIVGGRSKENSTTFDVLSDVWWSADGQRWTKALDFAAWPARYAHRVAVSDGRVWLLGGSDSSGRHRDVWHSTNCLDWELAAAGASWLSSGAQAFVAYNDKLWVTVPSPAASRDITVWSSVNGTDWEHVVQGMNPGIRYRYAMAVSGGKMWITGGYRHEHEYDRFFRDAWYSEDGANWRQTTKTPNRVDYGGRAASFGDRVYVTGGSVGHTWLVGECVSTYYESINDLSYTEDGYHWRSFDAPWGARSEHGFVSFGGSLWLLGGTDRLTDDTDCYPYKRRCDPPDMSDSRAPVAVERPEANKSRMTLFNDVWRSQDGETWQKIISEAPWAPRTSLACLNHGGKLWVVGGSGGTGAFHEVWGSDDGVVWSLVTSAAPWPVATYENCVSDGKRIWVYGTPRSNGARDAWSSYDGIAWSQHATVLKQLPKCFHAGALWAFEGSNNNPNPPGWYSFDGLEWTQFATAFPRHFRPETFTVHKESIWLLDGSVVWTVQLCGTAVDSPLPVHSADYEGPDNEISLSELLRVVYLFNSGGYECAGGDEITDDGYVGGNGDGKCCAPHSADYHPTGPDFRIDIVELLRIIQMYNMGGYSHCPGGSEDDYCPIQSVALAEAG